VTTRSSALCSLALVLASRVAPAQPLSTFLLAAPRGAEVREAEALVRQREAEGTQALGRLLPAVSARGGYTRNQFEVGVTLPAMAGANPSRAVITPQDQLEASVSLEVPLVDLGAWASLGAARHTTASAQQRAAVAADEARRTVARQWFTWVAAAALRDSATQALAVAERSVARTRNRLEAGAAGALDVQRAEAAASGARQNVTDATLAMEGAARTLRSLTGVDASAAPALRRDALVDEGPFEAWDIGAMDTPAVRAALSDERVSAAQARAAWMALVPTLSGSATQRWTNAAGFGPTASWAAGLVVAWRLDVGTVARARASEAAGEASAARVDRVLRDARDAVFAAWNQVRGGAARTTAARAQEESAEAAARTAHERLTHGAGTELEALLADRDAFAARVARVQADADLGYARVLLRLAAARPLDAAVAP